MNESGGIEFTSVNGVKLRVRVGSMVEFKDPVYLDLRETIISTIRKEGDVTRVYTVLITNHPIEQIVRVVTF